MARIRENQRIEFQRVIESPNLIKFMLDVNVIFAYLNSNNPFHFEAKTSIDALKLNENVWIIISFLTLGEFIAHKQLLGKKKFSIAQALKIYNHFLKSAPRHLHGGPFLNRDVIIKRYQNHARHRKLTKAGFTDFMLLTQVEEIKNIRILTCDKKMYECGKTIFQDRIYYLPNQSRDIKSDYPRLMSEIQNNFKSKNQRINCKNSIC